MRRGHVTPHSCALTQSSHKNTEWPSFTDGEVEPQGWPGPAWLLGVGTWDAWFQSPVLAPLALGPGDLVTVSGPSLARYHLIQSSPSGEPTAQPHPHRGSGAGADRWGPVGTHHHPASPGGQREGHLPALPSVHPRP